MRSIFQLLRQWGVFWKRGHENIFLPWKKGGWSNILHPQVIVRGPKALTGSKLCGLFWAGVPPPSLKYPWTMSPTMYQLPMTPTVLLGCPFVLLFPRTFANVLFISAYVHLLVPCDSFFWQFCDSLRCKERVVCFPPFFLLHSSCHICLFQMQVFVNLLSLEIGESQRGEFQGCVHLCFVWLFFNHPPPEYPPEIASNSCHIATVKLISTFLLLAKFSKQSNISF